MYVKIRFPFLQHAVFEHFTEFCVFVVPVAYIRLAVRFRWHFLSSKKCAEICDIAEISYPQQKK